MNVLYDRDHYKLALGQLHSSRRLIDNICRDYIKLLKFGDSLYRCKQLKRAALGRMVKILKRNKTAFEYLERIRQHLSRLPSIDPNTRTLMITGYPNVGKSSFLNQITRADVEVEPFEFTTKSLYVGHTDYRYLTWQVIDTPGLLDSPLSEKNDIEMQSITALAHLQASVLFFIDISEMCGYSIAQQVNLLKTIKPLFTNKPLLIVMNKIDIVSPDSLPQETKDLLEEVSAGDNVELIPMSNFNGDGINNVKSRACDMLLKQRTEAKMNSKRMDSMMNRLHVAVPEPRDDVDRPAHIPESVQTEMKEQTVAANKRHEWNIQKVPYNINLISSNFTKT